MNGHRSATSLASDVLISFPGEFARIHVPRRNKTYQVSGATLELLAAVLDSSGEQLKALHRRYSDASLDAALDQLTARGILSAGSGRTELPKAWAHWGEPAWFLQMKSRNATYDISTAGQLSITADIVATPPPPVFKCLCGDATVPLPAPRSIDTGLSTALQQRRTCRAFADAPIALGDLATILYYTAGTLFTHETNFYGPVAKKCAPSPGARHATEAYVAIRACDGIESGIYHYCSAHHALTAVRAPMPEDFLTTALYQQHYFVDAAATIFFTAVIDRIMWKYRSSRAYRLMHYEVAHYAQNLLLAGTGLGLGVYVTGALAEAYIEEQLGIDGVGEIPMYVAGVGPEAIDRPAVREGVALSDFARSAEVKLPEPAPELSFEVPDTIEQLLRPDVDD